MRNEDFVFLDYSAILPYFYSEKKQLILAFISYVRKCLFLILLYFVLCTPGLDYVFQLRNFSTFSLGLFKWKKSKLFNENNFLNIFKFC